MTVRVGDVRKFINGTIIAVTCDVCFNRYDDDIFAVAYRDGDFSKLSRKVIKDTTLIANYKNWIEAIASKEFKGETN